MMDIDESQRQKTFLEVKTRTELESDLERCIERKKNLEEEKNALHNLKIDLETMLKQREEELSNIRMKLQSMQSAEQETKRELESLRELRSTDQTAADELARKIRQIEQEKLGIQEENAELKVLLEQADHDKRKYKEYSDEADKLIEIKTGKLQADLREVQQLNQQYRREIQEKDEKIAEYEREIRRLTKESEILEERILTRKDMQVVSKEFMNELGAKLEDLKKLVSEFGLELRGSELVLKEVPEKAEPAGEVEALLAEPEHIDIESAGEPEPVLEKIETEEHEEGQSLESLIEHEEPLIEHEEPLIEHEEFLAEHEETSPEHEEPERSWERKLWEEPEAELRVEREVEKESEPEIPPRKEEEKFPWEDEDEEPGWGF